MSRLRRMQRVRLLATLLLGVSWVAPLVRVGHYTGEGSRWMMSVTGLGVLAVPLLVFAGLESRALRTAYEADVDELATTRAVELEATAENDRLKTRIGDVVSGRDRMEIYYQPIIDLASGGTVGHEALARFEQGPAEQWFLDAALVGLGVDLELAAVGHALAAIGVLAGYISVNVSPATVLDERFWHVIDGVDGGSLVVELTEHVLVEEYERYEGALIELRRRGIRIAVDDAGAGHSSMRHIVHMAPEIIKLDRSLISMIDIDPIKRSLVTALKGFAVAVDATLVAEGIERAEEAAAITAMGVHCGQGWLYSRALPIRAARDAQTADHSKASTPVGTVAV